MKCKKHLNTDLSSTIGVCATCLRERLLSLQAAQSDRRDSDPQPNYNSRRKSQCISVSDPGFCNTSHQPGRDCEKKKKKFSLFASFFKPKSSTKEAQDTTTIASTSSLSSPFWFSNKLSSNHNKKQSRLFSVEESISQCNFKTTTVRIRQNRGMSPARVSDVDDDDITNGFSHRTPESSKQTPSRACRRGGGQSGFSFCLSPLVRASPNRARNQKGVLPEVSFSGDIRTTSGKPPLSMATKYCANRSRKIADFGRFNHNH
ncbi:uncharacterized protein LOC124940208 [Impatiens glandulifera]|uniref:uncharacterized protein LOC124940208 n=1 Tax=Impatiens glandulifera TaxID=253017 RepID=UPI001FB0FB3E|nr:uncharacterized protein LOC124940208 [Impatiens glandulifera]